MNTSLYSELIDRQGRTAADKIFSSCIEAQIMLDYACARLSRAIRDILRSKYYSKYETENAANQLLMTHYTKTAHALFLVMREGIQHLWVEIEGRRACYKWSEDENCFIFADGEESPFFTLLDSETQARVLQEVQQTGICEF